MNPPKNRKRNEIMKKPESAKENGQSQPLPTLPGIEAGIDRRAFFIRNAVIGAAAVMTGRTWTLEARAEQAAKEAAAPKLGSKQSPELNVVTKSKGPVMTVA